MRELYAYSTTMSPENCGVFQLLKEVTFRGILAFYSSKNGGILGGIFSQLGALLLAGGIDPKSL